jgi:AraC-like DNA-binding protein
VLFAPDADDLAETILALPEDGEMVELTERFLRTRCPAADPNVARVAAIVERVAADRGVLRVEDLAGAFGVGVRTLQRLFGEYVGASPKWVVQRCRLLEAAERIRDGEVVEWAQLSRQLGYFDQAHFIRDFKSIVGQSPAAHASVVRRP